MSICSPRYLIDMALHSMCQPGRPGPHGESHFTSPSASSHAFHNAKSATVSFSYSSCLRVKLHERADVKQLCNPLVRWDLEMVAALRDNHLVVLDLLVEEDFAGDRIPRGYTPRDVLVLR